MLALLLVLTFLATCSNSWPSREAYRRSCEIDDNSDGDDDDDASDADTADDTDDNTDDDRYNVYDEADGDEE